MTNGATEVSFINENDISQKKYPQNVGQHRYRRILKETLSLAGIPRVEGDGQRFSYFWKDIWNLSDPWKFPYSRKYDHVTVTIRDSARNTHRNSSRSAWERFAKDIGAVLIEDADIKYMPVSERWDLYQCRMNFFVDNGPASLAYFSDAPYISMKWKMTDHLERMGFYPGFQFPWARENQRLVWEEDTYENIERAWNTLKQQ